MPCAACQVADFECVFAGSKSAGELGFGNEKKEIAHLEARIQLLEAALSRTRQYCAVPSSRQDVPEASFKPYELSDAIAVLVKSEDGTTLHLSDAQIQSLYIPLMKHVEAVLGNVSQYSRLCHSLLQHWSTPELPQGASIFGHSPVNDTEQQVLALLASDEDRLSKYISAYFKYCNELVSFLQSR